MAGIDWETTLGSARESLVQKVRFVTGESLGCPACGERIQIGERRADGLLTLTARCPRDDGHVRIEGTPIRLPASSEGQV